MASLGLEVGEVERKSGYRLYEAVRRVPAAR
jgi:hypothetical protein